MCLSINSFFIFKAISSFIFDDQGLGIPLLPSLIFFLCSFESLFPNFCCLSCSLVFSECLNPRELIAILQILNPISRS